MRNNKKTLRIILFLFMILPFTTSAQYYNQDSTWLMGGNVGMHLNQVQQISWAAGGDNLFGMNLLLNYSANYKKERHIWNNRAEFEYGFTVTDADGTRKSSDKIYLSTTYGYKIKKNLYISGLLFFNTQFADGYDYGDEDEEDEFISTLMAPGYLTIGAGLTWTPKPWFKGTFNPAAYRGIFVLNDELSDAGEFGVDPGDHYRTEFGANLHMEFNRDIMENVNLYSRASLFTNYLEKPENVDVSWEVKVNMNINKWLSASLSTSLIYDDDIKISDDDDDTKEGARLQFQEILGIGLQFKI